MVRAHLHSQASNSSTSRPFFSKAAAYKQRSSFFSPSQTGVIQRSPVQRSVDPYRPSFAQLSTALDAVPLSSSNHESQNTAPPSQFELTGLTDTEIDSLIAQVEQLMSVEAVGSNIQELDQRHLQSWKDALLNQKQPSRSRRDRIAASGQKAREFSRQVKTKGTFRTKHWYANMLPKAMDDLDQLLKTGEHLTYSDADKKKYGFVPSVRAAIHSSIERLRQAVVVPRVMARSFLDAANATDFLKRMEGITQQAQAGLSDAGTPSMPDDTHFQDLRGWHEIPGSFYEAFDIIDSLFTGVPDPDQLAEIDQKRKQALKHFPRPRNVESDPDNIEFGKIEESKARQALKVAQAGGLTYYLQLWIKTMSGKELNSDMSFGDKSPHRVVISFNPFDGKTFRASYDYRGHQGFLKGTILVMPSSKPHDPRVFPRLYMRFNWWEQGTSGKGTWEITEEQISHGESKTKGFWTQPGYEATEDNLTKGGRWNLYLPMPSQADLVTAASGNPP